MSMNKLDSSEDASLEGTTPIQPFASPAVPQGSTAEKLPEGRPAHAAVASSAERVGKTDLLAEMQREIEKLREERDRLREERDIYLEVIYQLRSASRTDEPLPTYEELMRSRVPDQSISICCKAFQFDHHGSVRRQLDRSGKGPIQRSAETCGNRRTTRGVRLVVW